MSSTPTGETTVQPVERVERLGKWSGESVPRKEDRRHLQGQAQFADDAWQRRMG